MAGKSTNSLGAKNWSPGPPATRYNASGKNREFYTFENAPGIGAYATGGTIIDGGDGYIYHIFTGDGTFAVNRPPAAIDSVDYLIVAGGGGSQPGGSSGGGGGGGLLFGNTQVSQSPYPITVGAGGNTTPTPLPSSCNGNPSTAFSITATGGGGGGRPSPTLSIRAGAPGGSGGGGASAPTSPSPGPGGTGNTPATIPRQGYPGGSSPATTGPGGAGGGGAGGNGSAGTFPPPRGGVGGPGRIVPEFPSTVIRRAIPAPNLPTWEPLVGPRGYAEGGAGSPSIPTRSTPASSGYGGEPVSLDGVGGGSGIVCIRYKKTAPYTRATGGTVEPSTDPEHPGVWRHIFTSPGDFTVTDPTLQYVDYLAVGGGGGGGSYIGGGGGAGGFVSSIHTSTTTPLVIPEAYPWNPGYSVRAGEQYPVGVATYPIGIGTGGAGGNSANPLPQSGSPGQNTTIGNPGALQIIAYGGGGGGGSIVHVSPSPPGARIAGGAGGSGGGACGTNGAPPPSYTVPGGSASPSPLIQGNPGVSTPGAGAPNGGFGGGAASTPTPTNEGWYSVLSPSAYGTPGPLTPTAIYRYFAGGGGGGGNPGNGTSGGAGGGGRGGSIPGAPDGHPVNGVDGTTNTGGGGGGGAEESTAIGGSGGPGIVIIQYPE
jgi:hypothetical protein